jgi:hypothetical protein
MAEIASSIVGKVDWQSMATLLGSNSWFRPFKK